VGGLEQELHIFEIVPKLVGETIDMLDDERELKLGEQEHTDEPIWPLAVELLLENTLLNFCGLTKNG